MPRCTTTGVLKDLSARFLSRVRRSGGASAGLICAAVVVSCGSSGNPQTDASGGPLLRLAQCVRAHGVPNFPDPSSTGGLSIPNDINTDAPAFKSARGACAKLAQSGGGQSASSGISKAQLLTLAKWGAALLKGARDWGRADSESRVYTGFSTVNRSPAAVV
jgi:hypothetical protein